MRMWRNWQTRWSQEPVSTTWGFKSLHPHQNEILIYSWYLFLLPLRIFVGLEKEDQKNVRWTVFPTRLVKSLHPHQNEILIYSWYLFLLPLRIFVGLEKEDQKNVRWTVFPTRLVKSLHPHQNEILIYSQYLFLFLGNL